MPPLTATIEDLIVQQDRRGIAALRGHLPMDFCSRAARLLFQHSARVLLVTGFYLANHCAPETDGPPGAVAIGRAVQALGGTVGYVIEPCLLNGMRAIGIPETAMHVFPVLSAADSRAHAQGLLAAWQPSLVISVEHCGQSADGRYRNSRGQDISALTAKPDALFEGGIPSIGIGDGGNEIGMGNLAQVIPSAHGLPRAPAVTRVSELVIASISNWGAYGLVTALSALAARNLLPSVAEERTLLTQLFASGCVDGLQTAPALGVDGFSLEEYLLTLAQLHTWLDHLEEGQHLHTGAV